MTSYITGHPFKAVRTRLDGPVLRVELNSPETGNAVTDAMLDDLLAVLDDLRARPDIRVLVLSGAGEHFCVGADRDEYRVSLAADPGGAALRVALDKAHRICEALETCDAVTVARLHGKVIGAGLALAVFCDLRVGADTCRFRMPEVGLGVPPAWGGALSRLVAEAGAARIRELMLTSEEFDAPTALRLSLLHKVAPEDGLDTAVGVWTRPIARRSPETLALAKRLLVVHSRANRSADTALLDAHLLSAHLAAPRRGSHPAPGHGTR